MVFVCGVLWHRVSLGSYVNLKNPVPCYSFVLIACGLWAGPESRSGEPTNAHGLVSTPRRCTLFWWYLGCGTGSNPGTYISLKNIEQSCFGGIPPPWNPQGLRNSLGQDPPGFCLCSELILCHNAPYPNTAWRELVT